MTVEPTHPDRDRADEHDSDCAVHNKPYMAAGPCDCRSADNEPFAYFQWNDGWKSWEQVVDEAAGRYGVVAAYSRPAPVPVDVLERVKTVVAHCVEARSPTASSIRLDDLQAILAALAPKEA